MKSGARRPQWWIHFKYWIMHNNPRKIWILKLKTPSVTGTLQEIIGIRAIKNLLCSLNALENINVKVNTWRKLLQYPTGNLKSTYVSTEKCSTQVALFCWNIVRVVGGGGAWVLPIEAEYGPMKTLQPCSGGSGFGGLQCTLNSCVGHSLPVNSGPTF